MVMNQENQDFLFNPNTMESQNARDSHKHRGRARDRQSQKGKLTEFE